MSLGGDAPSDKGVLLFSITSLRVQDATRVTQQLLGTHRVHLLLGDQYYAVAGDIRFPKGKTSPDEAKVLPRALEQWVPAAHSPRRGLAQPVARRHRDRSTTAGEARAANEPSAPHFCGSCAAFHNTRCPSGLILQRAPPNPSALAS